MHLNSLTPKVATAVILFASLGAAQQSAPVLDTFALGCPDDISGISSWAKCARDAIPPALASSCGTASTKPACATATCSLLLTQGVKCFSSYCPSATAGYLSWASAMCTHGAGAGAGAGTTTAATNTGTATAAKTAGASATGTANTSSNPSSGALEMIIPIGGVVAGLIGGLAILL